MVAKCVITGVKEFHYRNVSQYKLVVYIDDGSEIATVKIDPHIIENIVGFPPNKASNALASSRPEEASMIRENMARFQTFLAKFEGTLCLQKQNNSECLVAIKMKEGCSNFDAWQLADRIHFATGSSAADTTTGANSLIFRTLLSKDFMDNFCHLRFCIMNRVEFV